MNFLPLIITDLDNYVPPPILYDHIVNQHLRNQYDDISNSFKIEETKNGDLDRLYQAALNKAEDLFTTLEVLPNNCRDCFAYVSNIDFNRHSIHHHIRTSIINMVYYLNDTKLESYRDGAISIYEGHDLDSEIFCYKPRTGDLIIMPNWLLHSPLYTQSKSHRVAINMEIICNYTM